MGRMHFPGGTFINIPDSPVPSNPPKDAVEPPLPPKSIYDKQREAGMLVGRPLPEMLQAVEAVAKAILESRVRIETTIELGPPIKVVNRIVIDPEG